MPVEHRNSSPHSHIWANDKKSRLYVKVVSTPTPEAANQVRQKIEAELDRMHALKTGCMIDTVYELDEAAEKMPEPALMTFVRNTVEVFASRPYMAVWLVTNYRSLLWVQLMIFMPQLKRQLKGLFPDREEADLTIDRIRGFTELRESTPTCSPVMANLHEEAGEIHGPNP